MKPSDLCSSFLAVVMTAGAALAGLVLVWKKKSSSHERNDSSDEEVGTGILFHLIYDESESFTIHLEEDSYGKNYLFHILTHNINIKLYFRI
jgi:hypothetical protein